jgi:hypothetical protein
LDNNLKLLESKMAESAFEPVGFFLDQDKRSLPSFETSLVFQVPLLVLAAGCAWNEKTFDSDEKLSLVSQFMEFLRFSDSDEGLSSSAKFVIELSLLESQIHPLLHQFLATPDHVNLEGPAIDFLPKAQKQVRVLQKSQSVSQEEPSTEQPNNYLREAILINDLIQILVKLGRAMCASGRNPVTENGLGLSTVNLGVNNLPATVKTDLANKLLCLSEELKQIWSIRYLPVRVQRNSEALTKLLESLIPIDLEYNEKVLEI